MRLPNNITNTAPWGEPWPLTLLFYPIRVWERSTSRRWYR